MNLVLAALLSSVLAGQTAADDLELKLVFDDVQVALGDLAYCEVQLWNQSSADAELPQPFPLGNVLFTVSVSETSFHPSLGSGGLFSNPLQLVKPGERLSTRAEVLLWNPQIIEKVAAGETELTITATMRVGQGVRVTSAPVKLQVKGYVAPKELLLKLYADDRHRKGVFRELGKSLDKYNATLYSAQPEALIVRDEIGDGVLEQLLDQLRPDAAIYRKASIARLLNKYDKQQGVDFPELKRRLLAILSSCGSIERQWMLQRIGNGLEVRGRPLDAQQIYDLDDRLPQRIEPPADNDRKAAN